MADSVAMSCAVPTTIRTAPQSLTDRLKRSGEPAARCPASRLGHYLFMADDAMIMADRLAVWGRGAHALALLNAVNDRGWITFLTEPRDFAAVAAFSGLPPE
jgi:hypothetical protein